MNNKLTIIAFFCMILAVNVLAVEPTNLVVDFDSTSFDSSLTPGDSGILNLVIQNNGGYRADNVEVYIPGTESVSVDKRFYVGRLDASESKSMPVVVRVNKDATTGLTAVNIRITYDGRDATGAVENNQLTTWDVPLRVYGNPLFQLTPDKTTYYKDTVENLKIQGTLLSPVEDLEATLSSTCITVIGSSKQYVGDLDSSQQFTLDYQIKPGSEGACQAKILLEYTDESGTTASRNITLGLNIQSAGVDFKIDSIKYEPASPGETVKLEVALKNVGDAQADDTTISVTLSEPFVPVETSEKYVGSVKSDGTVETEFEIAVGWDAEIRAYAIPLVIDYKVGGTSYTVEKDIGLDVSGEVALEVISVEQSGTSLRIEVANLGTRSAEGIKATVNPFGGGNTSQERQQAESSNQQKTSPGQIGQRPTPSTNPLNMLSGRGTRPQKTVSLTAGTAGPITSSGMLVDYQSDIKPTKQTTFSFDTTVSGPFTLTLEYAGPNNERVTQKETLTVSGSSTASFTRSPRESSGTSTLGKLFYVLILAAISVGGYKLYKKRKDK